MRDGCCCEGKTWVCRDDIGSEMTVEAGVKELMRGEAVTAATAAAGPAPLKGAKAYEEEVIAELEATEAARSTTPYVVTEEEASHGTTGKGAAGRG